MRRKIGILLRSVLDTINKGRKQSKALRTGLYTAGAVLVFLVTYMMILPAITIEKEIAIEEPGMNITDESVRKSDSSDASGDLKLTGDYYQTDQNKIQRDSNAAVNGTTDKNTDINTDNNEQNNDNNTVENNQQDASSSSEKNDVTVSTENNKNNTVDDNQGSSGSTANNQDKTETDKKETGTDNSKEDKKENNQDSGTDTDNPGTDSYPLITDPTTLIWEGNDYQISAYIDEYAMLPQGVSLQVKEIRKNVKKEKKQYQGYYDKALKEINKIDGNEKDDPQESFTYARFFDISFIKDGKEIEPAFPVDITITLDQSKKRNVVKGADAADLKEKDRIRVVHFDESDKETKVEEILNDSVKDKKKKNIDIQFEGETFSVYGIVYTVDFLHEVDGKTYEFSLPGGGYASFTDLLEVLGVAGSKDTADSEEKKDDEASKKAESVPLTLGDVEVSDTTREFVEDVESVQFSTPDLLSIVKVKEDATVGAIKDGLKLECEYSADLTKDQIKKINAQKVEAGDWALISLKPFTSEETLTVTMKDGETFTIQVTDAQISTHVITADGEDFIITVTYGDDAKIPEGSILEADEVVPKTKEYEEYLAQAQAAISSENHQDAKADKKEKSKDAAEDSSGKEDKKSSDAITGITAENDSEYNNISFARFFDIRIMSGGEKIEPAAPVQVTVSYADALNVNEDQSVYAVHFGEKGTEVIDTSSDDDNKSVIFVQDSFSVTGTIVTSGGGWPTSGGSYVMYVQSGNNYYAVDHDGNLHQVSVSGNNLIFPDDAATFDLNKYLWKYERQQYYIWTNDFVYYLDDQGNDHYLAPNTADGISTTATNLSRNNNGRIYYYPGYGSSYYIGVNNNKITGNQNSGHAVPIQFASNFVLPRKVTIHFVDREGKALKGVSYTGSGDYPVTAKEDGTYTVLYNWDMGNAEYTLRLDKDFSKEGYTYASTHLAGTRQGTALTHDGLTIDAALKERNNTMYYYADAGDNVKYGSLVERNINDVLRVPNEGGTGVTDYLAANVDKDIYVIMDPVPSSSGGQGSGNLSVEDPEFNKTLEYNEDGTYTLSLDVKGHGINAATNPKANVLFVVDTSSSMDKTEGTGTEFSRLHDTKPALKTLASELLLSNSMAGKDSDTVEVSMISFDGGVVEEIGWTTDYSAFAGQVDNGLALHRGTDWEDALDRAYKLGQEKQKAEPDQQVFVVFFTDGEGSQYRNFHGQGSYGDNTVNPNYQRWYSYFLSRESAKDEARGIVNTGMQFYAVYAFNIDGDDYNGEKGSDLLRNLVKYAYNSENLGSKNFFAKASSTTELENAFNSILLSVREYLGFSDVVMNDDITSLTSTGINMVSSAVGGFTYTRSGGRFGDGTVWTDAPPATHTDSSNGDVTSVKWDLGNTVLEEGITYTVSFKVWPSQEAYDWLANLQNGTKTWNDVVAAGLDAPNGSNPQIVKNGNSYSLLTNKPSLNSEGKIINNSITYKKTHSETVTEESIPEGTELDKPVEGRDEDGNKTITTYTLEHGVYTKIVVTEKKTYFPNPDPMPLVPERMNVMKKWETSMNTSHPADELKFRVLVDGKYYQNDGTLAEGEAGQTNAKVLPVSGANSWTNSINIAPGIVKFFDDDGNALNEALVLETGHKYTLEEYDLMEGGKPFLYYSSYEFHSQTMRPMIVDGTLKYLVLVDTANPAPDQAQTYQIGNETYYVAASGSGQGALSGTNYRTAELDITKIIQNDSGAELTDAELDAESFTYRVKLWIPDGTDPAGIVGYEYVPRTQADAYTLFGYQTGEKAFESDIERFSGKTFRAWNTLVYRDLVEWDNVGGRIVARTDSNGNIIWKVPVDSDGYHMITYDMTLNRNEVIRFTNLPTGTKYEIQEIYANYYQADNPNDSSGHAPIEKASSIAAEGYEISQVLTTNGTVTGKALDNDTVSGIIDTPNVRYYNQFTNTLKSVKTKITVFKTSQDGSKPLPGAVFDLYNEEGYTATPKSAFKTGLISSDEEGKEGLIDLGSLADGVYYLVETKAPAGYILLSDPVVITVSHGDVSYSQENSSLDDDGSGKSGNFQTGYQLTVINDEGTVLPYTGGFGTGIFTILGSILLAGAGLVLWRRRRLI